MSYKLELRQVYNEIFKKIGYNIETDLHTTGIALDSVSLDFEEGMVHNIFETDNIKGLCYLKRKTLK